MAAPQSFGDLLKTAMDAIGQWFRSTFTWLTQDRASIREELTERVADMRADRDIMGVLGRGMLDNSIVTNGGPTRATEEQIAHSVAERAKNLSQEDKDLLRKVLELQSAGGFSADEMTSIESEARDRFRQNPQRGR